MVAVVGCVSSGVEVGAPAPVDEITALLTALLAKEIVGKVVKQVVGKVVKQVVGKVAGRVVKQFIARVVVKLNATRLKKGVCIICTKTSEDCGD